MAQTGTRTRIGTLFVVLWAAVSCTDARSGDDDAQDSQGAGAPGHGAVAMAGKSAAGAGASAAGKGAAAGKDAVAGKDAAAGKGAAGGKGAAAGTGAAGAKSCEREPVKHRARAMMCDSERSATSPMQPSSDGMWPCKVDADCSMGENGRCSQGNRGVWYCTYDECFADAECKGGPCICGEGGYANNNCLEGNCRTDADCGAKGFCSPSFGSCGSYSGVIGYYCHTCKDECVDDADCADVGGGDCRYEPSVGYWRCGMGGCVG